MADWGKPGLIRRYSIHPTFDEAALISRKVGKVIAHDNQELRPGCRVAVSQLLCASFRAATNPKLHRYSVCPPPTSIASFKI